MATLLVVGLGNPGPEYQWTPHNAGFLAVDRIAEAAGIPISNRRGRALTARVQVGGREVVLAKPETWMNLSGESVAALLRELDAKPEQDLLVLYDELALPLGTVRVRPGGSSGGHNGAKSINALVGTERWARIRIGVGPDGEIGKGRRGADYLLQPMRRMELNLLGEALDRAAQAVAIVATEGVAAAMNKINPREPLGTDQPKVQQNAQ
ncbi:aminoacyl-tRNA hydrolase [Acidipila sp. EB88]|uniref:aminoacyl-tRNA hydrolase n=1 Tax=Acidipila sp. EB88 TaxID=2305226 RepID=UPI001F16041D|nr:aminoacyl-tRNA hydrolase [Acidipila sp. EB88]